MYAIRFALWACAAGGRVLVKARRCADSMSYAPGRISFQFLTGMMCRSAEGLGHLVSYDIKGRVLIFERTATIADNQDWTAFVLFSGAAAELPMLMDCIGALNSQTDLRRRVRVVVCGPSDVAPEVRRNISVEYLAFDAVYSGDRFMVTRKKNHVLRNADTEKVAVLHSRIRLQPDCLAQLPNEFDLITPRVFVSGRRGRLPYLDMGFMPTLYVPGQSHRPMLSMHYDRRKWMSHLTCRYPYLDGAVFCVRKSLALQLPLADSVAWGESEDYEWNSRLLQSGFLCELSLEAAAISATCKAPRYQRWGHVNGYHSASRGFQYLRSLGSFGQAFS